AGRAPRVEVVQVEEPVAQGGGPGPLEAPAGVVVTAQLHPGAQSPARRRGDLLAADVDRGGPLRPGAGAEQLSGERRPGDARAGRGAAGDRVDERLARRQGERAVRRPSREPEGAAEQREAAPSARDAD